MTLQREHLLQLFKCQEEIIISLVKKEEITLLMVTLQGIIELQMEQFGGGLEDMTKSLEGGKYMEIQCKGIIHLGILLIKWSLIALLGNFI